MWNGLRTQEALEGGVFSKKACLSVGTDEEPCPYSSKGLLRDSYKGRQFGIAATRTGRMPKDFFDPTVRPLFEEEKYVDRLPYAELQPEKPGKGFMTSDYQKRDEYSLTLRAEQYRQQVAHENKMQKRAEEKLAAQRRKVGGGGEESSAAAAAAAQGQKKAAPLLFDLVFAGEVELCIKAKRDTRNPTLLSKERRVGPYKTTNTIHQAAVLARGGGSAAAQQGSVCSGPSAASLAGS